MSAFVTLLTDFGLKDSYVGVMKGVILSGNPNVTIIDISHEINPQDIGEAAFVLYSAFQYFPAETIHVIVVDPGVGSTRRIIGLQRDDATDAHVVDHVRVGGHRKRGARGDPVEGTVDCRERRHVQRAVRGQVQGALREGEEISGVDRPAVGNDEGAAHKFLQLWKIKDAV